MFLEKLRAVARTAMLHDEIGVDVARLMFDSISGNEPLLTVLLADLLKALDLAIARKTKLIDVKDLLQKVFSVIHAEKTILDEHQTFLVDFMIGNVTFIKFPERCRTPLLKIILENHPLLLRIFSSCAYEFHLLGISKELVEHIDCRQFRRHEKLEITAALASVLAVSREPKISSFIEKLFSVEDLPEDLQAPDFQTISKVEFDVHILNSLLAYSLSTDTTIADQAVDLLKTRIQNCEGNDQGVVVELFGKIQALCSNPKETGSSKSKSYLSRSFFFEAS